MYYLLYPILLIGLNRIGIKKIFVISIIISLLSAVFSLLVFQNHLSNVLKFYWTWVVGVVIAEMKIQNKKSLIVYLTGFLVMSIAFMFTLEKLGFLKDWVWAVFFSLIIFSFFSKADEISICQKFKNVFISLSGILVCYFLTFNESVVFHPVLLRNFLFLFAIISLFINFLPFYYIQNVLRFLLKPFVSAGKFSYALYIFHWPLILLSIYFFKDYYETNILAFICILSMNICAIFLLSWYCETRLQPQMAKTLNKFYYRTQK